MKTTHRIEPLEPRIAPATLTGHLLTYTDTDGDHVSIAIAKGSFAGVVFSFDVGSMAGDNSVHQQLRSIDFSGATDLDHPDLTMRVVKAGGDGLANVGVINATGHDLGAVTLAGDLGNIQAGDATPGTGLGLKSLNVRSLGRFYTATGGSLNADLTMESDIVGGMGPLAIKGDFNAVWLHVTATPGAMTDDGTIGAITIGGSLVGGGTQRAGGLESSGNIGVVRITHDIQGGTASAAGFLQSDHGLIKSVTLGGSLIGGTDSYTGEIRGGAGLGPVRIAGDVRGGAGAQSAFIASTTGFGPDLGDIASVTIGGSLLGGGGANSGEILSSANLGAVKILHDVRGGDGNESGKLDSAGKLTSVTIGGSLIGGAGSEITYVDPNSIIHRGAVFSVGDLGLVKIGGSIVGGPGNSSARITTRGALAGVSVHNDILGNDGAMADGNAAIGAVSGLGPVHVGGSIFGGANGSASIELTVAIASGGKLAGVTVGGSVIGGADTASARILATGSDSDSFIGPVRIGGDLVGGAGGESGVITSNSAIKSVTVGGSILGGAGGSSGGISAVGALGPVRIAHDLAGAGIAGSAALNFSGFLSARTMSSITIGGSIFAGVDNSSGALVGSGGIFSGGAITTLSVKGSIVGTVGASGDLTPVVISAPGGFPSAGGNPLAIGSVTVGGRVERALILAGYQNPASLPMPAQIGTP
ncbi:MAG TPA: hypothetical protein VGO11_21365, partial [Chthoniobacteraceae bacterium]|nr:hypothetical protein [Chthoniobacteraceae bacterium]